MNYHEIVNDRFNGTPVVLTYCPLCRSGIAFMARVAGRDMTFGVSGLLYNSDVLMYDRQTEPLWSQLLMQAVSGPSSGTLLTMIPTRLTSWQEWKTEYPQTMILTTKAGYRRNYSKNPYKAYDTYDELMFPVNTQNDLLPKQALVVSVEVAGKYKAYPFSQPRKKNQPILDTFNDKTLRVSFDPKSESVLVQDATGAQVPSVILYGFAWYAFHPETTINGHSP